MERRARLIWWGVLAALVAVAAWKFILPHGTNAFVEKAAGNREIVVYLTGAVEKPGLVHLPLDARLDTALKEVKLLPEADLDSLNPAGKLKDGQKIVIPYKPGTLSGSTGAQEISKGMTGAGSATGASLDTPGNQAHVPSAKSPLSPAGASALSSVQANANTKININTAGLEELDKLPGVGPALAGRIIQYRTEHGPFASPEDLQEVSGIGPKTYEKMASQVTVGP